MGVKERARTEGEQPRAEWVKPKLEVVPLKEAMGGSIEEAADGPGLYGS